MGRLMGLVLCILAMGCQEGEQKGTEATCSADELYDPLLGCQLELLQAAVHVHLASCLLYTSDAADE